MSAASFIQHLMSEWVYSVAGKDPSDEAVDALFKSAYKHIDEHNRMVAEDAWDEGFRVCEEIWKEAEEGNIPEEERTDPTNPYREW